MTYRFELHSSPEASLETAPPRTGLSATCGSGKRRAANRSENSAVEAPANNPLALGTVARIVCFGSIGYQLRAELLGASSNVDLTFLSRRGTYLGHTQAAAGQYRIARLRAQLATADDDSRAIPFGRAVVEAKVHKQMILLQRLGRRSNAEVVADAAGQMNHLLAILPDCGREMS